MATTSILEKRFAELKEQSENVAATKRYENSEYFSGYRIDSQLYLDWKVKAQHLLKIACGENSSHSLHFAEAIKPKAYITNHELFIDAKAVFDAAHEDFSGGYLTQVRSLIQAEVFGSELEQAQGLLDNGYLSAAAVVAGVVLETTLRQMCLDASITIGKLDKMNADLAKAGTYNLLVQKRITALADIRNNAAHGHTHQFKESDVADMISYIENFVADHV